MKFIRFLVLAALLAPVVGIQAAFAAAKPKSTILSGFKEARQRIRTWPQSEKLFPVPSIRPPAIRDSRGFLDRESISEAERGEYNAVFDSIGSDTLRAMDEYACSIDSAYGWLQLWQRLSEGMGPWCKNRVVRDIEEIYRNAAGSEDLWSFNRERDGFIYSIEEPLSRVDKDSVERFFQKVDGGFGGFVASTREIFGASSEQRDEWMKRFEDLSSMRGAILEKIFPSEYSGEFLSACAAAEKTAGTPEERSVALAKIYKKFAKKHSVEVVMPKWAQEAELETPPASSKKDEKKPGETTTPSSPDNRSFLGKHPLALGFGTGTILLGASVLKSVIDYKNNPPRDEDGNIIPMKTYVLQQLASFDPKTVQCWLKVGAIAAVAAGVYVYATAPAAA